MKKCLLSLAAGGGFAAMSAMLLFLAGCADSGSSGDPADAAPQVKNEGDKVAEGGKPEGSAKEGEGEGEGKEPFGQGAAEGEAGKPSGSTGSSGNAGGPAAGPASDELPAEFINLGGTKESEAAVMLGLKWLADHQAPDGHWSVTRFNKLGLTNENGACKCTGLADLKPVKKKTDPDQNDYDIASTALALLPYLARGETHRGTQNIHSYSKLVEQGMKFLLAHQAKDGSFVNKPGAGEKIPGTLYPQGMATLALCELYGMSRDPILQDPCQRALNFIVKSQHSAGGWRYIPKTMPGDMSVTSWQAQALKSGQLAGLIIPVDTPQKMLGFMETLKKGDGFCYQPGAKRHEVTPSMTACAMLTRQYIYGGDLTKGPSTFGVELLKKEQPSAAKFNMYYYYYATQVLLNVQGDAWKNWNPKMRDLLIKLQDKGTKPGLAHQKGSWAAGEEKWDKRGGRHMITCLALLTLEVYYRHLPLNADLKQWLKDVDIKAQKEEGKKKGKKGKN